MNVSTERAVAAGLHDPQVVVVQTNLPHYRETFFELLLQKTGSQLALLSGDEDFAAGVRPLTALPFSRTRNRFLLGRRVMWQSGVLRPALRAQIAVLILNPRLLTVWVVLVLRRLLGRRTVLWGHAWPRRGRGSGTDRVRHLMRRMASTLIVYTETEARELRQLMPRAEVVAAPNALYTKDQLAQTVTAGRPRDFLYVGRLVPEKKPRLLLEAFLHAVAALPSDIRLVFLGDGPLRDSLTARALAVGPSDRVIFGGHVSDLEHLREAHAHALATVSPGYVGLSLIQSLGFGVPMLIARQEPHSPEIEAALEGENAIFFDSDSPEGLSAALVRTAASRDEWRSRRPTIASAARGRYTIETMVDRFLSALHLHVGETVGGTR